MPTEMPLNEPCPSGFTPYYPRPTFGEAGCEITYDDPHNTEAQYPCPYPAAAEIFTTSGTWARACTQHAKRWESGKPRAADGRLLTARPLSATRATGATEAGTRTPSDWEQATGIRVLDPDGWRNDGKSWDDPITEEEFRRRASESLAALPRSQPDRPATKNDLAPGVHWRTGRHVGRTIYLQPGPEANRSSDVLIGVMDTPYLADLVCRAVNAQQALPTRAEVLAVAEASIAGRAFGCGEAAKVIDALHAAGLLPWREET